MPSRTEGFGLAGLEALSAGLPVLVSHNSGFADALCSVPFGSFFVVKSEDPTDWTAAITKIWAKDRKSRLEEVETLRDSYDKKYNWAKQIKGLLHKMISWTHGMNVNCISYCVLSQLLWPRLLIMSAEFNFHYSPASGGDEEEGE